MIKNGGRPLDLTFVPGDESPPPPPTTPHPDSGNQVNMVFTQPGPLGLRFTNNAQTGAVELLEVNPGTQASAIIQQQGLQLRSGMMVASVQRQPTTGKSYDEVLNMIKAGGRPLHLVFDAPSGSAAAQQRLLEVTFSAVGPLGLRFAQNK
jgi:hypothetical protein